MEPWQEEHIRSRFVDLVKMTNCNNTEFINILYSAKILNYDDVQNMRSISRTPAAKAQDLYLFIIPNRVGSYFAVKDALFKTDQSGAYAILDERNGPDLPTSSENNGPINRPSVIKSTASEASVFTNSNPVLSTPTAAFATGTLTESSNLSIENESQESFNSNESQRLSPDVDVPALVPLAPTVTKKRAGPSSPPAQTVPSKVKRSESFGDYKSLRISTINSNFIDTEWNTELHVAAQTGNYEEVTRLLQDGVDVNARNKQNETPLHSVSGSDRDWDLTFKIIKILLSNEADASLQNNDNQTFLGLIVLRNNVWNGISPNQFHVFCKFLQERQLICLFNVPSGHINATPFLEALRAFELLPETLDLLQKNGVKFNETDNNDNSSFRYAIWGKRSQSVITSLKTYGADWNHINKKGQNLIHIAVECNHVEALKFLLDLGLTPDKEDNEGNTPLHLLLGSYRMYYDIFTPFQFAAEDILTVAGILVENGADTQIVNEKGLTPLEVGMAMPGLKNIETELRDIFELKLL